MNSPTEVSSDTQLILDELRKLSAMQSELFADLAVTISRMAAPFAASISPALAAISPVPAPSIVADNWGGLFDGGHNSDEQHPEASIVADNWGGLFEQPAHDPKERSLNLSAVDYFMGSASSVQIHFSEVKAEPVLLREFGPSPVGYALPVKPEIPFIDLFAPLAHVREEHHAVGSKDSYEEKAAVFPKGALTSICRQISTEHRPAADELPCLTTKEERLTIEREEVQIEAQPFSLTVPFEQDPVQIRDSGFVVGALSAPRLPRRARLRMPPLRRPRRAPPLRRPRRAPAFRFPWRFPPRPPRLRWRGRGPHRRRRPPRLPQFRACTRPRTEPPQGSPRVRLRHWQCHAAHAREGGERAHAQVPQQAEELGEHHHVGQQHRRLGSSCAPRTRDPVAAMTHISAHGGGVSSDRVDYRAVLCCGPTAKLFQSASAGVYVDVATLTTVQPASFPTPPPTAALATSNAGDGVSSTLHTMCSTLYLYLTAHVLVSVASVTASSAMSRLPEVERLLSELLLLPTVPMEPESRDCAICREFVPPILPVCPHMFHQMISQFVKLVPAECNHDLHALIQQPPLCCKSTAHLFMLLPSPDEVHCLAYVQHFCQDRSYLGLAIVVFQDLAEHAHPRYLTAYLAHAYLVDGATVRLYSTNASHVVPMALEGMGAQNMMMLGPPLAVEMSRHAHLHLWQQSEAVLLYLNVENIICNQQLSVHKVDLLVLELSKRLFPHGLFQIEWHGYTIRCIEFQPWPPFWYSAVEFGSCNATSRLLVDYELLKPRISWGGFLHSSAIAQPEPEPHMLHSISSCCIPCGLVQPIKRLHLLLPWTSNSFLVLLCVSATDAFLLLVCCARRVNKHFLLPEHKAVEVTFVDMKVWFDYNLSPVLLLLVYTYVTACIASGHSTMINIPLSYDVTRRWMDSSMLCFGIILMFAAAQACVFLHEGKFSEATHITMGNWIAGDQTYTEEPGHDFSLTTSSESVEALNYGTLAISSGSQLLLPVSMAGCALTQERVQQKCGGNCRYFLLEETGPWSPGVWACSSGLLLPSSVWLRALLIAQSVFLVFCGELKLQYNADCLNSTFSKPEFLQFPWDPGGSILLHRLGGKPSLKERGMSAVSYGWAVECRMGLAWSPLQTCWSTTKATEQDQRRGSFNQTIIRTERYKILRNIGYLRLA